MNFFTYLRNVKYWCGEDVFYEQDWKFMIIIVGENTIHTLS